MIQFHLKKIMIIVISCSILLVIYYLSYSESVIINSKEGRILNEYGKPVAILSESMSNDFPVDARNTWTHSSSKHLWPGNNHNDLTRKSSSPLFGGEKVVHLDLKGAPPRASYFDEFFPLIKSLGATGLLVEYEDMFPYSSIDVAASNSFSKSDINHILNKAKENNLQVIPLVQTFGHMEFVLKLQDFEHLREVQRYPQVICPSHNGTMPLVKSLIDRLMESHPDVKYLHIGCDEVYNLAECNRCIDVLLKKDWNKQQLFLSHVEAVARYIKERYPGVKPLVWDDMFRKVSVADLKSFNMGSLVEPVVWKYTPTIDIDLEDEVWDKYSTVFGTVWIASAFKGATGADKIITDIEYHLENHRAWMKLVAAYKDRLTFKGIMMTGWQRYDHFAVLCELLPVGLPSLAVNLAFLNQTEIEMRTFPQTVQDILKCGPELLHPSMGARCSFPGSIIFEKAHHLANIMDQITQIEESSEAKGWMTPYNIHTGFSSPSHVEGATNEVETYKLKLQYLEQGLRKAMSEIFLSDTVDEWMYTYIHPLNLRLQSLLDTRNQLLSRTVWPRRPLKIQQQEL